MYGTAFTTRVVKKREKEKKSNNQRPRRLCRFFLWYANVGLHRSYVPSLPCSLASLWNDRSARSYVGKRITMNSMRVLVQQPFALFANDREGWQRRRASISNIFQVRLCTGTEKNWKWLWVRISLGFGYLGFSSRPQWVRHVSATLIYGIFKTLIHPAYLVPVEIIFLVSILSICFGAPHPYERTWDGKFYGTSYL